MESQRSNPSVRCKASALPLYYLSWLECFRVRHLPPKSNGAQWQRAKALQTRPLSCASWLAPSRNFLYKFKPLKSKEQEDLKQCSQPGFPFAPLVSVGAVQKQFGLGTNWGEGSRYEAIHLLCRGQNGCSIKKYTAFQKQPKPLIALRLKDCGRMYQLMKHAIIPSVHPLICSVQVSLS